jgi:hypothetical protein
VSSQEIATSLITLTHPILVLTFLRQSSFSESFNSTSSISLATFSSTLFSLNGYNRKRTTVLTTKLYTKS